MGAFDARDDDDVGPAAQLALVQAVDLAEPSADLVAAHGVADLFADGEADEVRVPAGLPAVDDECGGRGALSLVVEAAKLMVFLHCVRKFQSSSILSSARGGLCA